MKAHIVENSIVDKNSTESTQPVESALRITQDDILDWFGSNTFARGNRLFLDGDVQNFHMKESEARDMVDCTVMGGGNNYVSFSVDLEGARYLCSCKAYKRNRQCPHVVAGMLEYVRRCKKKLMSSDYNARRLMDSYLKLSQAGAEADSGLQKARLVPFLSLHSPDMPPCNPVDYPSISFKIGRDRLYVLRNIKTFLENMSLGETVTYGKALKLCHEKNQFDETTQTLIEILQDEFPQFRSFSPYNSLYGSPYGFATDPLGYSKDVIALRGVAFDQFFTLYQGQALANSPDGSTILLEEKDPSVSLVVQPVNAAQVKLQINYSPELTFFGSAQALYAADSASLMRCSDAFREKVWPMLRGRTTSMMIGCNDLPTFCSCVLPEVEDLVTVEDRKHILQQYTPDDCLALYYFDWKSDEGLRAHLECQYGDKKLLPQQSADKTPGVKRNVKAELAAVQPLEQYLQKVPDSADYGLTNENDILNFLSDGIGQFHRYGEVYISERIRNKRIDSKHASVGVSVSGDILTLDIDTGEFPAEELQALYKSLLQKKRFYRLADGRYLTLDGSPYEKMAEIAQMTQLAPKELKKGQIKLPAYRGLYLDKVLEGSGGEISVKRNTDYKELIRSFKTVEDSDYPLPEQLAELLRPYQRVGFQWLKTLEASGFGGILADEMGLGKTVQMIAFLCTARRADKGLPSLVICPASLILNWSDELGRFAPQLKSMLVMGTAAERKAQIEADTDADVWVTSYDLVRRDSALYEGRSFYACVLDEGQNIKNQSTVGSKAVKQIACRQRFIMTGTPIENRLSELWNLFDFLMPGYLFSNRAFVDKLEKPIVQSGDPQAKRQLSLLVQPFILRRLKKDVLKELPPKIEHVRKVALSETERKVYLGAVVSARQSVTENKQNKLAMLAVLTRLRQICCDPNLCFENYEGESSKLEACLELCSGMVENGHQILLFSQFTTMLAHIEERLRAAGISYFVLEGSTPKEQRARLVKDFNAGKASIFLISLKAGGTGLNLTAADVVIHYDPWWNLAAQDQATDRAHRMGQQQHVQVYKLIAKDTIEEKILQLQEKKAGLMEALSGEQSTASLSKEEILALLD